MKNLIAKIPNIVSYFFIILFIYASVSKILDFENFQVQIGQSPLLSAYAGLVSYSVIAIEIGIILLLTFPRTKTIGLYTATALMSAFTIYIFLILNYSDFIPCSCGGVLEKLGWTEHLIFNILCVIIGITAVVISERSQKTTRTISFLLVLTNILSCLLVVILFFSSEYIIKKENNFTRRFLIHPIIQDKVLDIKVNSYYFAGIDEKSIYLGNLTAPLVLTVIDHNLTSMEQKKISVPDKNYPFRNLQMQTYLDSFYLYDGTVPIIYKGSLKELAASVISYNDAYFTQIVVLDSAKFALRTQNKENREYTIASLDLNRNPKVELIPRILEKQIDGVFDSDGYLLKKSNNRELVYPYSYRNQFMVMDDHFKLLGRYKTIDTVETAKIKVTSMSDGRHKMSAPPIKINKSSTANRNLIFIESSSMGKSESSKAWKNAVAVDMYYTNKQEYAGSFYINHRNNKKLSQMLATDQYLYALIGNELIRYQFTRPVKKIYQSGEAENLYPE